jgi:biopolymer transport protein ExbD
MAEINMPQKSGKRKLQPPRLDLTPMVDLGFILITFFIFTTTLARSEMMKIEMPSNEPTLNPSVVIEESVITLIPVKDHNVLWYEGSLRDDGQVKLCAIDKVRDVLLQKQKAVRALPETLSDKAHKMYVIIKPNDNCKYADVVQLLDEMIITGSPDYCLMDVSAEEKEMIARK